MDPDEFADVDQVAGEDLSPGEKAKLVHFVIEQNNFQLGKTFCRVRHVKKACRLDKRFTINEIVQKYYRKNYPDFCRKYFWNWKTKIPTSRAVNNWKKNMQQHGIGLSLCSLLLWPKWPKTIFLSDDPVKTRFLAVRMLYLQNNHFWLCYFTFFTIQFVSCHH